MIACAVFLCALLTWDEARRIAANVVELPQMLLRNAKE